MRWDTACERFATDIDPQHVMDAIDQAGSMDELNQLRALFVQEQVDGVPVLLARRPDGGCVDVAPLWIARAHDLASSGTMDEPSHQSGGWPYR